MFRKKKNKTTKENQAQDKVAGKISGFAIRLQTKFSNFMSSRLSGVSLKKIKILLIGFCLLWGGLSAYFIVDAVFGSAEPPIKIDRLNMPEHINQADGQEVDNKVDPETYRQIQDYKRYMDSTHQSIRPGMLDSMKLLEQIFLSQQKNEANE